jgi:hypothetical protein
MSWPRRERREVEGRKGKARVGYCSEALLTLALCTACAVALGFRRGMWLDEAWTIWFTYPGLPFALAYDRWLDDPAHPHLYLLLQWLLSPLTGTSVAARRLIHLPLLLILVVPTVLIVRRNTPQRYLRLVAIAFATNPFFITYFAEHRPYYLALTSVGCLTLLIRFVHVEASAQRAVRWPAYACLFAMTFIAFNIHYTIALTAAALLGCSVLSELRLRHLRLAVILSASAGIALIAVFVQLIHSLQAGEPIVPHDLSVPRGMLYILGMIGVGLVGNPVLAWCAGRSGWDELRGIDELPRQPGSRSFAIILIGTLIVCALGFAAMHLITRTVAPRLLIGILAPAIILVVELASWRSLRPRQFRAICIAGALLVLATTLNQANNRRWEHHLARIKQIISECPATRVLAFPLRQHEPGMNIGEQEEQVHPFAYQLLARQNGFTVETVPNGTRLSIRGVSCPVLLWREHEHSRPNRTAAEWLDAAHVDADPRQIAASRVERKDHHILVIVPPLATADH